MPYEVLRPVAVLALFCVAGQPATAWAPETRVRIVEEAVRLMPSGLRVALEGQRDPLLRGMLLPLASEDGPEHAPPWAGGQLPQTLEASLLELTGALGQPQPSFGAIAERFGRVAHYVADAGFPPGASEADGATRYAHFAAFCESRRERFPLVFYGHEEPALGPAAVRAFAASILARSNANDRELGRAYAAAGDPPDPAAFDDRSVPFAVGSLSYSRTINDIVNLWLAAWRAAGGDTRQTPYAKRTEGVARPTAPKE